MARQLAIMWKISFEDIWQPGSGRSGSATTGSATTHPQAGQQLNEGYQALAVGLKLEENQEGAEVQPEETQKVTAKGDSLGERWGHGKAIIVRYISRQVIIFLLLSPRNL